MILKRLLYRLKALKVKKRLFIKLKEAFSINII